MDITEEQIKKIADESPSDGAVLRRLFPGVFKHLNFSGIGLKILSDADWPYPFDKESIEIRSFGSFRNRGFYLSSKFDWEILTDSEGIQVLVPTKK